MKLASVLPAAALAGLFVALRVAERRWPLRVQTQDETRRNARNLAFSALSSAVVRASGFSSVEALARRVERRRIGLLHARPLPPWLRRALAVVLLDYTLYVWHVLLHRVALLWRFHEPHHVDLDMDVSTGVRFHFGELVLSLPWRAAQVAAIGVRPADLLLWQRLTLASILFHHSNVRLPPRVERAISLLVETPHLHGIHHSTVRAETDSNWSSGLALWDVLHGTRRTGVAESELAIGVPAYRDPDELELEDVLALPFRPRPDDPWALPDGRRFARGGAGDLSFEDDASRLDGGLLAGC